MSKKKDTVSVIVRPTKELMTRLNELKEVYPRESANQILVEIATMYTELWAEAQEILKNTQVQLVNEQWERMRKLLKLPLYRAEAKGESSATPHQSHGRKRK